MKIIFEMDQEIDIKEKWKIIRNFPNYAISNFGKVKRIKDSKTSKTGKILKPQFDKDGYLHVNLCKNGKGKTIKIHKLVTETFLGPCPKGYEVNHKDGDKENPLVNNLEYVTVSENQKHAFRIGLQSHKGEKHPRSKLKEKHVLEIRKLYKTGNYLQGELAGKFNTSRKNISNIVNNKCWRHTK